MKQEPGKRHEVWQGDDDDSDDETFGNILMVAGGLMWVLFAAGIGLLLWLVWKLV